MKCHLFISQPVAVYLEIDKHWIVKNSVNNFSDSNNGLVSANLDETRAESPSPNISQIVRVDINRHEDHEDRRKKLLRVRQELMMKK